MSEAHLALMTKPEELDAYTHTVLHQFPKLERHLLCAEMRAATNKLLRLPVFGLPGFCLTASIDCIGNTLNNYRYGRCLRRPQRLYGF